MLQASGACHWPSYETGSLSRLLSLNSNERPKTKAIRQKPSESLQRVRKTLRTRPLVRQENRQRPMKVRRIHPRKRPPSFLCSRRTPSWWIRNRARARWSLTCHRSSETALSTTVYQINCACARSFNDKMMTCLSELKRLRSGRPRSPVVLIHHQVAGHASWYRYRLVELIGCLSTTEPTLY